jgi:glycosidase
VNPFFFISVGITEKLDHLKDLGVGTVWLSPIYKSPMADNGYDISDFYDVDPSFGTLDDFDKLKARAKDLGEKHMTPAKPWLT